MASKGDIHLEEASGQEARPQPEAGVAATPSDVEVLERAAELLARPNGWTKGAFSRNAKGVADAGGGRWATKPVCFCLRGALAAAAGLDLGDALRRGKLPGEAFVEAAIDYKNLVSWNDRNCVSQEAAVRALRRAAELAAKAEGRAP